MNSNINKAIELLEEAQKHLKEANLTDGVDCIDIKNANTFIQNAKNSLTSPEIKFYFDRVHNQNYKFNGK